MTSKKNVVLYLDKELVEKTRNLGFNLSKTFENRLKQLITQFSNANSKDKRALEVLRHYDVAHFHRNPGRIHPVRSPSRK